MRGNVNEHQVVIAGGGPTGLMLAGELALAGVDVAIVERRINQEIEGQRAGGLHSRSIEVLDQRGIAERFLAEGQVAQIAGFAWIRLDMSDFPSRHPYGLALWQTHIERILAGWVNELGVHVYRGSEVIGFAQDASGVTIEHSGGVPLRAGYLAGCDGGRSLIRKTAGIDFAGWDPSISNLIVEAELAEEPEWGLRRDAHGVHSIGKTEDGARVRILLTEPSVDRVSEPTLDDVRVALKSAYGSDYGIHSPTSVTRFTDMSRQAAAYRQGRVLLAGDAAHIHYPTGGQGLNIGLQDAVNLGWKLAQVVKGTSPDSLLDTYHAERHPVAARVLSNTMAQVALLRPDERTDALREHFAELLTMDQPRKRFAGMLSGLDIHYDLGEGHPLLGRRMPDLDLVTSDGPARAYSLLHSAHPVLLDLGRAGHLDVSRWSGRLLHISAQDTGSWELPVIGAVAAPSAVLIRPDGYVGWVGDGAERGLEDALTRWVGPPTAA
ncbi:MAG: FAD-dependent monooxygenase [Chloroflexi bacterium]|nr:FAD-dependent monooxygenase [Chloroflexota bacterium]